MDLMKRYVYLQLSPLKTICKTIARHFKQVSTMVSTGRTICNLSHLGLEHVWSTGSKMYPVHQAAEGKNMTSNTADGVVAAHLEVLQTMMHSVTVYSALEKKSDIRGAMKCTILLVVMGWMISGVQ
eukprot:scaffold36674_cov60-Attheya_sp.AAC.1